jgi:hypothetical protein
MDIRKFLAHYRKLSIEAVCTQKVGALDLGVWVHRNGRWHEQRISPQLPTWPFKSASWCRLYLQEILKEDYSHAKHRLGGSGLTGVYLKKTRATTAMPKFALVYVKKKT